MNSPSPSTKDPLLDSVIADKYRLDRVLGTGGMGTVYAAFDLDLRRNVAVKLIRPELCGDPEAGHRLLREAQITASFGSRNFVHVYAAGQDADQRLYCAQEMLPGHTLADELVIWRGTPRHAIARIIVILKALATAHANDIIHRDVKPRNIFIARDGLEERIVLLDFGLGKVVEPDRSKSGLTVKGAPLGTPEYMSPEQYAGVADIDARTDVWAVGVVLYEMLANETPWETAGNVSPLMLAMTGKPVPDVREASPWPIPEALARVVSKALEWDRSKRYANATEFLNALLALDLEGLKKLICNDQRRERTPREMEREKARWEAWARRPPERDIPWTLATARWLVWSNRNRVPDIVVMAMRRAVEQGAWHQCYDHPGGISAVVVRTDPAGVAWFREAGFEEQEGGHFWEWRRAEPGYGWA